jgi:hypothetical protein
VVGPNSELQEANKRACAMVGKDHSEITGRLAGQVMECVYARHPGGCGQSVHCEACTIRRSVTRTHRTGEPVIDVESYQEIVTNDGPKRVLLRISTAKSQDSVLLKIVPA